MVERDLAKVEVAGSSPVIRSIRRHGQAVRHGSAKPLSPVRFRVAPPTQKAPRWGAFLHFADFILSVVYRWAVGIRRRSVPRCPGQNRVCQRHNHCADSLPEVKGRLPWRRPFPADRHRHRIRNKGADDLCRVILYSPLNLRF